MTSITDAYLLTHAIEIRFALALFAIGVSFAAVNLLVQLEGLAKSLRTKSAQSGSTRLDAVGAR